MIIFGFMSCWEDGQKRTEMLYLDIWRDGWELVDMSLELTQTRYRRRCG
jgi:hypothetical protein